MKTILLGPILSLLPRRWREAHPLFSTIHWPMAAAISGITEFFLALLAYVYRYSYSVTHWARDAVYAAINAGADIPPTAHGFAGLALMFLYPFTWVIALCAVEGVVRFLGGAFADEALGSVPLFLAEKVWVRFTSRGHSEHPGDEQGSWSSFLPSIQRQVSYLWQRELPDEVEHSTDETGEKMTIRASHPKSGWEPPRVICCDGAYYRLEATSEGRGARPFVYVLRRLPAGLPGRSVIKYSPPS